MISFSALKRSTKNVERNIKIQQRTAYLQEMRSNCSTLFGLSSDLLHARMIRRHALSAIKEYSPEAVIPESIKFEYTKFEERLTQVTSDFHRAYHSLLILLDRADDPDQSLERSITELYKALCVKDDEFNENLINERIKNYFNLFRDFSQKKA